MKAIKYTLQALLVVALISGVIFLKFSAWRVQHPQAPAWSFILSGK